MTHHDPRDPDRIALEPTRLDGGRRPDLDPPTDPRLARGTANNWGLIGGLAAVLVLGIVIFSMMGGNPGNPTSPVTQTSAPAPTQTTAPAPAQQPAPDPATTGSTPPRQAP
ncbi:hypothetical protein ACJ4V0_17550 [Phreatobacter sp. HK31-P]